LELLLQIGVKFDAIPRFLAVISECGRAWESATAVSKIKPDHYFSELIDTPRDFSKALFLVILFRREK
jgi:hypothetical protein